MFGKKIVYFRKKKSQEDPGPQKSWENGNSKGAFFQQVIFVFQISQKNIPKNYPELEI